MEKTLTGRLILSGECSGLSLKDSKGKEIKFDGDIVSSIHLERDQCTLRAIVFKITNNE